MIHWIQCIHDEQREDEPNQLNQRHHDDDGNDRRQNESDDLLEALVILYA